MSVRERAKWLECRPVTASGHRVATEGEDGDGAVRGVLCRVEKYIDSNTMMFDDTLQ